MVIEIQKQLEIMADREGFASSTPDGIKNHSLLVGMTGGIRFLFVLRDGSLALSSTDQVDWSEGRDAEKW